MTISVIVPTLNESKCIERTLSVVADQLPHEIVVVDAGSTDSTTELAAPFGTVLSGPAGRANQLNQGAAHATGDVLVFLHADTILPDNGLALIRQTTAGASISGAFRLKFDSRHPLLTFSSFCTRFASLNICFGDRCIFTSRTTFDKVGGFPAIPIFEDVEFVKRAAKIDRFEFLSESVITSSRRYQDAGVWRQQWKNCQLWMRYQLGQNPLELASEYRYDIPE